MSTEMRWARDLAEAIEILAEGAAEGRPWTSVVGGEAALERCAVAPERALLLGEVVALKEVEERESALSLGTLVTSEVLGLDPNMGAMVPSIAEALESAGPGVALGELWEQLRDGLVALGAEATILSQRGMRIGALGSLEIEPDELIFRITVSKGDAQPH